MRPVLVGICGGVAAGKSLFAKQLVCSLGSKYVAASEIEQFETRHDKEPDSACYIMRGLTLFSDQPRRFFDVKVFLDVDADVRLCRMLKAAESIEETRKLLRRYQGATRPYHTQSVLKQRALADVHVNGPFCEKDVDLVVGRVLGLLDSPHRERFHNEE